VGAVNGTDDRYRVESSPLAGTRRVFAAIRVSDQARLVVKRPRAGHPLAQETAVLRHEFAVLSRLEGTPVSEAYDLLESPDVALVLAAAPGRSVDALIAESLPDAARFASSAAEMTRTLAAVHARGFVHRDLKPHHFFIDDSGTGQATLIDFGLATHLTRERRQPVEPDEIQGTLAYISPEQTGRTSHSTDYRSDLYSLGVTLYELWTGKRPFESEDALELIHAHIARTPPPLRQHRSGLPRTLEQIVLRLLAKSPDERYQTAAGLLADLERARTELGDSGQVTPFSLGQHDYDGTLRVPEKLYGRAAPREALLEVVRVAQGGARALALIAGSPGVGKSALVQEIHREIMRGGHFVSGKFDQYSRGTPYSALTKACSELVRVYLASTVSELEDWRRRLRLALGDNARVIVDVVPELVVALGEQPEVAALPANEAQTRFERTFRRFMEASACKEAPLVLFLDDLQWADTASLAVLELVLSSDSQGHLLIIGSYRDSEVEATHPLARMLERLERRVRINRIELQALALADVRELLSDALRLTQQSSDDLASLLFAKTSGNPFFIAQFLERLAAEGHLRFEAGKGYAWDLEAIAALGATDNVVELVVARLGTLAPRTRELLQLAGCIGHTFRLRTLSVIAEDRPGAVVRALLPAVMGGYLVPLGQNHHLLEDLLDGPQGVVDMSYRFAHDRVQQAALSTNTSAERSRIHLRIGRLLLSAAGEQEPSDDQLFEVVTQLNLGRQHLENPDEKLRVAQLNLSAARRARSAAAHASAAQFADICVELLGERSFAVDYDASLNAHFVAAESYHLLHDEQRALKLIDAIEANARRALDRVAARNLKATIFTNQGRPQEATAISVETLDLLGLHLPDTHDQAALGAAIGETFEVYQAELGSRDVATLCDLKVMNDPVNLAVVGTLASAIPAVFQWNHGLMVLLVLKAVRLSLEHGTAPISPFFYAQYGIVHHVITGDLVRAHEFGQLALALARRPEHVAARGGVEFIYAEFLAPWVRPRTECSVHFKRGISSGLDAGDQIHAGYCMAVGVAEALYAGQSLAELQLEIPGNLRALEEQGDVLNHLLLDIVSRSLSCLRGETSVAGSLDGEGFSEQLFEAEGPPPVKAHYGAIKAMLRFLFGDAAETRRVTEAIQPPPGVVFKVDYVFYHGMACAELARVAEPSEREVLLAKADADLACFEPWVRVATSNFFGLQELLRAEIHAARDEPGAALAAYERAVEAAAEVGVRPHLALAYERLAGFQLRSNRKHVAQLSLGEAVRQYELWGATGKARQLSRELPQLRPVEAIRRYDSTAQTMTASSASGGSRLDLESATRAVSAIASEIRLEPLLLRLTQILLENAGATRGVLLLAEGGEFVIRAALRVQSEQMLVEPNELDTSHVLASSVVRYCARTLESVVLDNAARDNRFAQDPFVERRNAKSIACVPLVHQGQLVGVLYLENDTATGAFHAARVERLEFLAGHAAVSLQNARLYDELQAANENLERRVHERTTELSKRNQDMRRVLDNVKQGLLSIDLEGRLATEHSRVVDEWLGTFEPGTPLRTYLAPIDARFVERFDLAFEQLLDGVLPEELLIDQFPQALAHGPRRFHLSYEPIYADDKLSGLLVVIDDVTEALRRAEDEAEQKDILTLCHHLSKDHRGALLGFFEENSGIIEDLRQFSKVDAVLQRNLHTLKGNAAMYGFATLAESCHAAEEANAEGTFEPSHLDAVAKCFTVLRNSLASIAGDNAGERVNVSRATLRTLAQDLAAGLPAIDGARAVERLLLEPIRPSLERLGKYARALATRMGKPEPRIEIADGGLFVDSKRAAPLFASLVHLVRNAMDHGLETEAERAASGKQDAVLSLRASVQEGEAVITIEDDGRGVDWDLVRERARARGLPADSMSDLAAALFANDFSTRHEATSISGRGVGLAAVQAEVRRMSGRAVIESQPGRGTLFSLFVAAEAFGIPRSEATRSLPPAA
jgi:predicted ATPase/HPt (histidine-containing phosphotransfer) domain-containing protein/two-component sensor histidine kinase